MSVLNQRTKVEICGDEYTIKSDISPQEVHNLAKYVNVKMREIKSKTQSMPANKIAVLACLNITEELIDIQKHLEETQNLMEEETTKILRLLDEPYLKGQ